MHSNGQTVANRQINLPTDIQGQTDSQPASQTNRQTNKETSRMKERKKGRKNEKIAPAPNNSAVCCLPIPVARMRISLEKAFLHHEIAIQAHDGRIDISPPILAP